MVKINIIGQNSPFRILDLSKHEKQNERPKLNFASCDQVNFSGAGKAPLTADSFTKLLTRARNADPREWGVIKRLPSVPIEQRLECLKALLINGKVSKGKDFMLEDLASVSARSRADAPSFENHGYTGDKIIAQLGTFVNPEDPKTIEQAVTMLLKTGSGNEFNMSIIAKIKSLQKQGLITEAQAAFIIKHVERYDDEVSMRNFGY